MSLNKNVISILDGAIGSCGKGKVIGEIASDITIPLGASISNCMPNAGHTYVNEKNEKFIFTNIPISIINPKTELFIGPGSVIDMMTFAQEYERHKHLLKDRKIYVHELVPLVEERHKQYEKDHIKTGSTYKGCGACLAEKVLRDVTLNFFKKYKNAIVVSEQEYLDRLYKHLDNPNEYVILEGAQGTGLCLNHSGNNVEKRYTTSRNVSTTQLLADSGISAARELETIMVIRPFPIRISNITKTGKVVYTGDFGTGVPLTWTQINLSAMQGTYPYLGIEELYDYCLSNEKVEKLLSESNEIAIKQIFGKDISAIHFNEVTLLEALELERLINKNKGNNYYKSKILFDMLSDSKDNLLIRDLSEYTTVTQMERRIGDLDINQLFNYCRINNPYGLYLNFFQHLNLNYEHEKKDIKDCYFDRYLKNYLNWLEENTKTDLLALGTGAKNGEKILVKSLIKR
ncbi:MAG: adenylosuccinate synthetase [Bacilli bacterium]|nr:adenylosuccinate synthetase [Bacilli bacterium]